MPRQQPEILGSASSLRSMANTLRSAIKENLPDALEKIANASATAFEGTQTAIEGLEARLRRLAEPNVSDPMRRAPLVVSGDRLHGGVSVRGPLNSARGQSLDLTLENQTGYIYARDHIKNVLLDLVLNGTVTATAGGDLNITGHYQRNGTSLVIANQSIVTGSRAIGGIYQNTTGKTMFVLACWDLAGKNTTLRFVSDANPAPGTEVAQIANASPQGVTVEMFCLVLPNYYYSCQAVAGGPNLVSWVEYT
jgi:hypothetical protein